MSTSEKQIYEEIKNELIDNEINKKVKDYSKNKYELEKYYNVGKLLSDAGKHYGDNIIDKYSKMLIKEVNKKYTRSTLFRMKQLFVLMTNRKVAPSVRQLNWSQCLILIPIKDINKINYYINQIVSRNLSKRQLEVLIKSKEYERLPDETKSKLIKKEESKIADFIKDPIIIKTDNKESISERILKKVILADIDGFLSQLGSNFSYVGNEYKIKLGNAYNYIDLLLYNIEYNCYVVIELKVTELKKEHIGQIQIYMNYIDNNIKKINQDKTIGIIICKKDNKYIIGYASDKRIYSTTYLLK